MKLLKILILIILITGCVTKRKTTSVVSHDTIIKTEYKEKIIHKDSLVRVFIPAEEDIVRAYYECDSLGKLRIKYIDQLKNDAKSNVKIKVVDNYVEVAAECDSGTIYTIWKSKYESITSSSDQNISNTSATTDKKTSIPWWMFLAGIGLLAGGFIIGYIVKKFF